MRIDEARLLQEVAVFADKSNIDEELTRLKSHISQFKEEVEPLLPDEERIVAWGKIALEVSGQKEKVAAPGCDRNGLPMHLSPK